MALWIVIVGFVIGFGLAFSIGANDVANSFGTSVGSHVLTLRQACILASIFELLGSILIGSKVSNTISKGVIDVTTYSDTTLLQFGYLSALIGACTWLMVATAFKLPVSGTHSIVGSVIGFTLVAQGINGVNFKVLIKIIASWFISPLASGAASSGLYFLMHWVILRLPTHLAQLERGILVLPIIYLATFAINSFSIFYRGPKALYLDEIPIWAAVLLSLGVGAVSAIAAKFLIGPLLRRHIIKKRGTLQNLAGSKRPTPAGSKLSINAETNQQIGLINTSISKDKKSPAIEISHQDETAKAALETPLTKNDKDNGDNKLNKEKMTLTVDNVSLRKDNALLEAESPMMPPSLTHSVSSLYLVSPFNNGTDQQVHFSPCSEQVSYEAREEVEEIEYPGIFHLFSFLQVLTACFGAFAHGGNDVSNAIGPVVGLWAIYDNGDIVAQREPEIWILAVGGIGISLGLWVLGRRVIETVGSELSEVTPPSGFCIELGAASTVLVASQLSVPVSTTHCKIGSVVFVGLSRGGTSQVDWRLFRNIILAWLVTVPASGLISAGSIYLLKTFVYQEPEADLSVIGNMTTVATTTVFNNLTTAVAN